MLPSDHQVEDYINQKEMHTIAEAFTQWSLLWKNILICIYTNSLVASDDLIKIVLKDPGNLSLWFIIMAAIRDDVAVTSI